MANGCAVHFDDCYVMGCEACEGTGAKAVLDHKEERIAELEAALQPFAALGHATVSDVRSNLDGCEVVVSVRQMRRAMAAMPDARSTKWIEPVG